MWHIGLHFVVPMIIAGSFYRERWRYASFVMIATMLVDLDHLVADPIYDPQRCSIGFHPLHGLFPILLYTACLLVPRLRLVGIGLLLHMLLDGLDCLTM